VSIPFSEKQFGKIGRRARVRTDKVVATQNYLDPAKVRSIAAQPAEAVDDPLVHAHNGRYYVGDGHHRVGGALDRGDDKIRVRVLR